MILNSNLQFSKYSNMLFLKKYIDVNKLLFKTNINLPLVEKLQRNGTFYVKAEERKTYPKKRESFGKSGSVRIYGGE